MGRAQVLAWGLAWAAMVGCSASAPPCGPANCGGCCGPNGDCLAGDAEAACGIGGQVCGACASGAACTLGGCAAGPDADAGAGRDDGGVADAGAQSPREVTGRYLSVQRLRDGGLSEGVVSLSGVVIAALVEVDGGYVTFPGSGDAQGAFRIPSVPPGAYMLRLGGSYLETDRSLVEIRWESGARPASTQTRSTINPTMTTLRVTGLLPWAAQTDAFALATPQLGLSFPSLQAYAPSAFVSGADSATLPLNFVGRPMVEAEKGDESVVVQQRFTVSGSSFWGGAVAGARVPPYTQLDGVNVTVDVQLLSAPTLPSTTLPLAVDHIAFDAQSLRFPPPQYIPRLELGVHGGPRADMFTTTLPLWYADMSASTPLPSSMSFVSPHPTDWALLGKVVYVNDVTLSVPGVAGTAWARNELGVVDEANQLFASRVGPRLGPVGQLTLDGVPFTATRTGVGRAPRVGWSAPELGTPTTYYVNIGRLGLSGGQLRVLSTTSISTARTSVLVPPDVLIEGQSYYLQVLAVSAPFDRHDFTTERLPYAWSGYSSPVFSP